MAKYIMVFALSMMVVVNSHACDACGCSVSGQGIGLLTNYRTSVAGVRFYNVPFHATPSKGNANDQFNTFEVFLRYQFNPRMKMMLTQPYRANARQEPDAKNSTVKGISDTRLLLNYALVDKWVSTNSRIYWELGAGIKLPIGKYNVNLHSQNLPDNFNIGNGSWGYLLHTGTVFSHKQFGVSMNAQAQLNGKTSADYHFGNQYSGSLLFFIEKTLGKNGRIVPLAGVSSEIITNDKNNTGNYVKSTGGTGTFATIGLNAGFGQWQIGASYAKPFIQNYSDGKVLADGRFSIEMNFLF